MRKDRRTARGRPQKRSARAVTAAAALVALVVACRREPPQPERTEPWPATPPSAPASARSLPAGERARYAVVWAKVELELPLRKGSPTGRVTRASGSVDFDPNDPSSARGKIDADLTSLELLSGDGDVDPELTKAALDWLGLGAEAPAAARASARVATFELLGLEATHRDGWLARGTLSLHGMRAPASVELEVTPSPTSGAPPASELVLHTRTPLVVSFATHDIRARDGHGAPLVRDRALESRKIAREARVSVELRLRKQ